MANILVLNTPNENYEGLFYAQVQTPPEVARLPESSIIYDVDLNTRSIKAPRFLSVSKDHKSAVFYFKVSRYYDHMDLTETICLIQYIPPGGTEGMAYTYVVPFYDIKTFEHENKILIPWVVSGAAAQKEGSIQFAIRFYKVSGEGQNAKLIYNLNTLPAKSQILHGLELNDERMEEAYEQIANAYESLISDLSNQRTTWVVLGSD